MFSLQVSQVQYGPVMGIYSDPIFTCDQSTHMHFPIYLKTMPPHLSHFLGMAHFSYFSLSVFFLHGHLQCSNKCYVKVVTIAPSFNLLNLAKSLKMWVLLPWISGPPRLFSDTEESVQAILHSGWLWGVGCGDIASILRGNNDDF